MEACWGEGVGKHIIEEIFRGSIGMLRLLKYLIVEENPSTKYMIYKYAETYHIEKNLEKLCSLNIVLKQEYNGITKYMINRDHPFIKSLTRFLEEIRYI